MSPARKGASRSAGARGGGTRGGSTRGGSTRGGSTRGGGARGGSARGGDALVERLELIEREGGDGEVRVGRARVRVTSLDKPYFPADGITKGDVMRYYARVAPLLLPLLRDRPLVLKRSPEGIDGEIFFQQKPPANAAGVARVEVVETEIGAQERVVGGDLATLLHLVQFGCISMDPWSSRVGSIDSADYAVLDLDPGPKAGFGRVVEVALLVREALDVLGLAGTPKTSGSRGIHIVVPLPTRTSFDDALAAAERIARAVAELRPDIATVERSLDARPPGAVYVDYLQNARGKSVAAAYSVRAKPGATVSMPLEWREVGPSLDPHAFTVRTVPALAARRSFPWREALRRRNPARALRAALGRGR
jgi:bifunctional non-homologous end joining protein LigD